MIIEPQHEHEQTPPPQEKAPTPPKPSTPPPSPKQISRTPVSSPPATPPATPPTQSPHRQPLPPSKSPDILTQMLQNSLTLVHTSIASQIRQKLLYMQQKVHFSFSDGPSEYLRHLRGKRKPETESLIKEVIQLQTWLSLDDIFKGKTKLYERSQISSSLNGQISHKLKDMKKGLLSLSSMQRKASSYIENLLEFKKKNYWQHETENKKNVRTLLSKMKRIQSQQQRQHDKEQLRSENNIQMSIEKEKMAKEETRMRIHSKEIEKHAMWRKERERVADEDKKKKEEIEERMQKYKLEQPTHVRLELKYIRDVIEPMEEERERKLDQIRRTHQPIEPEEIEEHVQKYQEYKESLMDEHKKKGQEFVQNTNQVEQNLKELYHGKFHKDIEPRFYNSVKQYQRESYKKVKDYSVGVIENHRPRVDLKKRDKIEETIRELQLKEDKTKRKIRQEDGSYAVEDKVEYNAYRIGVQYLDQLKVESEGKPRKKEDRSASLIELPTSGRAKRIDYLRENKPKLMTAKKTIGGDWKKVVGDSSFSPRQKYEFIMEQSAVLQQKSLMKEAQMRSYKKGDRAMELKGEMDRYYAESVAAKMVVLKDVIMK